MKYKWDTWDMMVEVLCTTWKAPSSINDYSQGRHEERNRGGEKRGEGGERDIGICDD